MASADVVAALADVTLTPPTGGVVQVAGPEPMALDELLRRRLAHDHDHRPVLADNTAGYFGAVIEDQNLTPLPGSGAIIATTTYDGWLAKQS